MLRKHLPTALLTFSMTMFSGAAHAVRPFVTDDARIVDYGQIELENWLETSRVDGKWNPAPGLNAIGSTSVNDWLQILAGTGTGLDAHGNSGVANPMLSGKILLRSALADGTPGYAVSLTGLFDGGHGHFAQHGSVFSLTGMTTYRLWDDSLNIHINLGTRSDRTRNGITRSRVTWGVGLDIEAFNPKTRLVAEVYSGDPLELNAPRYAGQLGMRYLFSDYVQMDFITGIQPELDERLNRTGQYETTFQLGLRLLFDAFTPQGKPGNPNGAKGLF